MNCFSCISLLSCAQHTLCVFNCTTIVNGEQSCWLAMASLYVDIRYQRGCSHAKGWKLRKISIHYIDKSVPGKSESSATNTNETTQQPVPRAYYIIPLFSGRCFHDSILHNAIGTHPARCHQSPITERPLYSQSRFFNSLILFRLSRHITIYPSSAQSESNLHSWFN